MTDNAKHTPTPWCVLPGVPDGGGIGIGPEIEGIGPHAIVTFNGGSSEANAAFIVAAVNAHAELVAALRDVTNALTKHLSQEAHDRNLSVHVLCPCYDDSVAPARAALAKVQP